MVERKKNIFQNLADTIKNEKDIVWFHCASLGEFEQAKPIIEGYKNKYPCHKILLTFFLHQDLKLEKI